MTEFTKIQSSKPVPKPTMSHMLGEMVWLFTQSPIHRNAKLAELEWLLMPPLMLEQYRVLHDENTTPVGMALWAWLDEAAEKKLMETSKLDPLDWRAGLTALTDMKPLGADAPDPEGSLWIIELITPAATEENKLRHIMLKDLMDGPLKGKTAKMQYLDIKTNKRTIVTVGEKR